MQQAIHPQVDSYVPTAPGTGQGPLCVDLDGTLVATDLLWESFLILVKKRPLALFLLPFWLLRGKAHLKREIAKRVQLNAASLPYRQDVLAFLKSEDKAGRKIVLATASDQSFARSVADHLGIFSTVLASDGNVNLSGTRKLAAIKQLVGDGAFDYIGDSEVDLPLWESAKQAILVAPSDRLMKRVSAFASVQKVFPAEKVTAASFFKALRIHQWIKNVLLVVPIIVGHRITNLDMVFRALWAFLAFSFCASSVYVLNDLMDLEADRLHVYKKFRPFAAGTLKIPLGLLLIPLLLLISFSTAAYFLPLAFVLELLMYFAVTLAYSLRIKQIVILDVLTLAGLYTIRVLAGGAATGIPISPWLLAFSAFLFLSLAFMKRYSELRMIRARSGVEAKGRDYNVSDMELLCSLGPSSGLLCILVLALYVNSADVALLYRNPLILWLIGPCLLYWIARLWLLAHRGRIEIDPIIFTAKDPVSYVVGAVVVMIIIVASVL